MVEVVNWPDPEVRLEPPQGDHTWRNRKRKRSVSMISRPRVMTDWDNKITGQGWVPWEDEELRISINDGWLIKGIQRRGLGTMTGYVDKHYMAPDGEVCRSRKGLTLTLILILTLIGGLSLNKGCSEDTRWVPRRT